MVTQISAALGYFNLGHFFLILLAVPGIFFGLYFLLRNKSEKDKVRILMIIFAVNAAVFISYKLFMAFTYEEFILLNELPIQLCNFNLILLPIAVAKKNKFLMSYLYYVGSIGAVAAIFFFDSLFLDKGILNYGVIIYFLYHGVLLATGILIPVLKLYTPKLKDILKAHAVLLVLAVIMHGVNVLMRHTGICIESNYFYTYGLDDNPLLSALKKLIPVHLIYFLPLLPIVGAINCLMYLPFKKHMLKSKTNEYELEN